MVPCSTHGRVASAFRTRVGQPTAQVIPGTRKLTSDRAGPWVGWSPGRRGSSALAEFIMNNIPCSSLLTHCLQHIPGRDLIQLEGDVEAVCFKIDIQGRA